MSPNPPRPFLPVSGAIGLPVLPCPLSSTPHHPCSLGDLRDRREIMMIQRGLLADDWRHISFRVLQSFVQAIRNLDEKTAKVGFLLPHLLNTVVLSTATRILGPKPTCVLANGSLFDAWLKALVWQSHSSDARFVGLSIGHSLVVLTVGCCIALPAKLACERFILSYCNISSCLDVYSVEDARVSAVCFL